MHQPPLAVARVQVNAVMVVLVTVTRAVARAPKAVLVTAMTVAAAWASALLTKTVVPAWVMRLSGHSAAGERWLGAGRTQICRGLVAADSSMVTADSHGGPVRARNRPMGGAPADWDADRTVGRVSC